MRTERHVGSGKVLRKITEILSQDFAHLDRESIQTCPEYESGALPLVTGLSEPLQEASHALVIYACNNVHNSTVTSECASAILPSPPLPASGFKVWPRSRCEPRTRPPSSAGTMNSSFLLLWTLSTVWIFNRLNTRRFGDWICLRLQVKRKRGKKEKNLFCWVL
jgi:hypothetical protein